MVESFVADVPEVGAGFILPIMLCCQEVSEASCACSSGILGTKIIVTSECTALLSWKLGFGGVSDSGFSLCTVPTYYCGSDYFYNQHPQVQNLIRTEHSLNRSEHRVKSKAS